MNIGILTKNFTTLIGARDFIISIVESLANNLNDSDNLYVFITKDRTYNKFKGLKRVIHKLRFLAERCFNVYENEKYFQKISNITIINYKNDKELFKKIQKLNIECLLPNCNADINYNNVPFINYLFDCQHQYYPEFFTPQEIDSRNEYFSKMVKNFCIVNSRDAKNDLIKFYNADEEKIFSLPFTPKVKQEYLEDNSDLLKKYKLPDKYLLMSNQFWLHKDHTTLFKAFAEVIKTKEFENLGLICTGTMEEHRKPTYIQELKKLLEDLNIKEKVHLLGLIPKLDQIEIMKNAELVIQTTLFEGGPGGGEIWDSCALGVRSIISDIPINKEIEDELVTFFEKGNYMDLANKIINHLKLPKPAFNKEILINKSLKNIETLHNSLMNVIEIVVNSKKGNLNE